MAYLTRMSMLLGVLILATVMGLVWLAAGHSRQRWRLYPRRSMAAVPVTVATVDRQHRHLQAGGMLGNAARDKAKSRFGELLEAGRMAEAERELRPGLDFAIQVRALVELGTPVATKLLEQQLDRAITSDPVEQAWYWVDVATGLRQLNRREALPAVLRCAEAASGLPQGVTLAAEAVAFPNFASTLFPFGSPLARSALRALVTASRGVRDGLLDPAAFVLTGGGDALADVTECVGTTLDPWATAAVVEAERVYRRFGYWARVFPANVRAHAEKQALRLRVSQNRRAAWLAEVGDRLLSWFPTANPEEQSAVLRCLAELRVDVARLFPDMPDRRAVWWPDAIRALRWSKSPVIGPMLASQAAWLARYSRTLPDAAIVLTALRGHPYLEVEQVLLVCLKKPALRPAAIGSLGWWVPFKPDKVIGVLRSARASDDPTIRRAAGGALARLGERTALAEIAARLQGEEPAIRAEAAATIAAEGLSWLWPYLEDATTTDDPDTVLAACEALERLREDLVGL